MLNEVLRLTTLATYGARYSDDDVAAGGYLIPAGTPIMMALGVSLKNETVWKDVEKWVSYVSIILALEVLIDLITLNVLTCKAKIYWHLLHLVMDVANVQDITLHTLKLVCT